MAWYFRVIELADGQWACRLGLQQFNTHTELRHAVEHLRALAHAARPAELFLHRLDGSAERIGVV
jgi:hypothetical protein